MSRFGPSYAPRTPPPLDFSPISNALTSLLEQRRQRRLEQRDDQRWTEQQTYRTSRDASDDAYRTSRAAADDARAHESGARADAELGTHGVYRGAAPRDYVAETSEAGGGIVLPSRFEQHGDYYTDYTKTDEARGNRSELQRQRDELQRVAEANQAAAGVRDTANRGRYNALHLAKVPGVGDTYAGDVDYDALGDTYEHSATRKLQQTLAELAAQSREDVAGIRGTAARGTVGADRRAAQTDLRAAESRYSSMLRHRPQPGASVYTGVQNGPALFTQDMGNWRADSTTKANDLATARGAVSPAGGGSPKRVVTADQKAYLESVGRWDPMLYEVR